MLAKEKSTPASTQLVATEPSPDRVASPVGGESVAEPFAMNRSERYGPMERHHATSSKFLDDSGGGLNGIQTTSRALLIV
jgi:hypothetical protein